ncbi:MAG: lipopolysaccharide heptosyltransferase II [Candidatus Eisenbacteria sp.]|nr:lipopolysaccharide heptosyltransferase II [Candidatus Eisenbacteria bacterium]
MPLNVHLREMERVVVRVPNWIGDAVFSVPALRAIVAGCPEAEVTLLGPRAICEVLLGIGGRIRSAGFPVERGRGRGQRFAKARRLRVWQPQIGWVFPESFSSAMELGLTGVRIRVGRPSQWRGALLTGRVPYAAPARTRHLVDEYVELVTAAGAVAVETAPRLGTVAAARERAAVLLPAESGLLRIGLVAGAAFGPAKRWLPERFAELGSRFEDAEVVLFGSDQERFLAEFIASQMGSRSVVLAGRTNLQVLAACLERCSLVVGNDTGPTHLAAAVGTPVVAIFGSTDPGWTGPRGPSVRVVRKAVDCAPCYRKDCDRNYRCLREITVDEVWEVCRELLEETAAERTNGQA